MGKKTKIILENRKMFCMNPDCPHTTFAETFAFLPPKGKKSMRLQDKIVDMSLHVSSLTASELLKDGIADVGKSTICNLLKKGLTIKMVTQQFEQCIRHQNYDTLLTL